MPLKDPYNVGVGFIGAVDWLPPLHRAAVANDRSLEGLKQARNNLFLQLQQNKTNLFLQQRKI